MPSVFSLAEPCVIRFEDGCSHSVSWTGRCWNLLMKLRTAGIQVDSHQCWRAADVTMHPTCKVRTLPASLKEELYARQGSCTAAIALSMVKLLYSLPCCCSTKTMTLTNKKLGSHIAMELDMAAIGAHAHTLVATAPSLGLLLEVKFYISEGRWREVQPSEGSWRNTKATAKIYDRMRLFSHPANSVVGKSIAFSMYMFSTMPYFSSFVFDYEVFLFNRLVTIIEQLGNPIDQHKRRPEKH